MRPLDKIAMVITATTAVLLLVVVAGPLITGVPMSDAKARMVSGLVSSFIAILSMYVGSQMKDQQNEKEQNEKEQNEKDRKP